MYDKENVETVSTAAVLIASVLACGYSPDALLSVMAVLAMGIGYALLSAIGKVADKTLMTHVGRSAYVAIYGWPALVLVAVGWHLAKSF